MGYYIFSLGIKTDQIQKAFGSKDDALLGEVENNPIFQNYVDNDFGDNITTEQALVHLINGKPMDKKVSYAYGYATIGLCATLGTELPYVQEIKSGYETDLINKVLAEDFGIADFKIEEVLLADNSHPFPLPKIEDWPVIGLVRGHQLKSLGDKLNRLNITDDQIEELSDDPDEKGFAYEHLKGITDNVNFCIQNNIDLVSFCH